MIKSLVLIPLAIALSSTMSFAAETPQPGKQVPQALSVGTENTGMAKVDVPYLFFLPAGYQQKADQKWPLMLFLHGLGESGNGQLDRVQRHGPPALVARQPNFPFILVSPQCPQPRNGYQNAWQAKQLIQLVDHVAGEYRVDPAQIYVTGLSMGGYGAWRLAAMYPDRFAAVAPICGGGKVEYAPALAKIPVWAFHGAKDNVVPIGESQQMIAAIEKAGGRAKLTTYPTANHDSWTVTYANPKVYEWLLDQCKEAE